MRVLVVNAGSSSLKLHVGEVDRLVAGWDGRSTRPLRDLLAEVGPVDAVGHRVVHGGEELVEATLLDDTVIERLVALTPLAPLHQARSLAGIRAARSALPAVPHVACFDTAYHADLPPAAATYALPAAWRERWPLRRFGFHGLSHGYAARRTAELVGRPGEVGLRVVTCHLGAGASLCASLGTRSLDTTMGFTPLDGLVMASRSGAVDPGLVLWLTTGAGLSPDDVSHQLEHGSGLVGLAGTDDMREVLERLGRDDPDAALAFDVYIHVLVRNVAAMAAALGGLDALTFTGGVGEHAPAVRSVAADRLGFLGVRVDPARNTRPDGDRVISPRGSPVTTAVVTAREDLEIARQVEALLAV